MNPSYTLGLDVAKRSIYYHLTNRAGQRQAQGSVAVSAAGLTQLLRVVRDAGAPADVAVVVEATGLWHVPWAEALSRRGYVVFVVNALVAHRVLQQTLDNALRGNKTDRIDAAGLAELGRQHAAKLGRFRYQSEPARFGLQRLVSVRQQLRSQLTNLRKAYGSLLGIVFPELSLLLQQSIHTQGVRALLAQAPTAAALRELPRPSLQRAFGARTDAVLAAARASLVPAELAAQSAVALAPLLTAITQLEDQLKKLDSALDTQAAAVVTAAQLQLVRSIGGIGPKTARTLAAYLPARYWQPQHWQQHPSRRRAVAQLLAYAGAEPRVRRSGQWVGQMRMSKRGCEPLRTALFQSSFCAMQRDTELAALYAHHSSKGKAHKVAISHLIRRRLQRLVAVLQSGQPFTPKLTPHALAA